jgi:hypothetical protein
VLCIQPQPLLSITRILRNADHSFIAIEQYCRLDFALDLRRALAADDLDE